MNNLPFGTPLQFVTEFPSEITDSLWSQGVNLDDWDYAILASRGILIGEVPFSNDSSKEVYRPVEWNLERILVGCCDNTWYKVKIEGQEYALGIAYHG